MKKVVLSILFLALLFMTGLSQEKLTFIQVDASTYSAYLKSDWNTIIEKGKVAVEQDIDYFYLRMRLGYAYFMKKRYSQAIKHYRGALNFNTNDATALEFLYYSYKYAGRTNDAIKLCSDFSSELKNYLNIDDSKKIVHAGFYTSASNPGPDTYLEESIISGVPQLIDGSQLLTNRFTNFNLDLSNRIGYSTILHHSVNLLYKNEFAYSTINNTPYISESQTIRQLGYSLNIDITPIKGLTFSPLLSIVNYRIPIFYDYGYGGRRSTSIYGYDNYTNAALGIAVNLRPGIFDLGFSAIHSNYNLGKQNTFSGELTIYPFSNQNLYYKGQFTAHFQSQNNQSIHQLVNVHGLGFKIMKNLWLEANQTFGEFSNLHEAFTGITYNSLELYKSLTETKIIVPIHKNGISLFASFRYIQSESMFVPEENIFDYSNNKTINYKIITGGISWKL